MFIVIILRKFPSQLLLVSLSIYCIWRRIHTSSNFALRLLYFVQHLPFTLAENMRCRRRHRRLRRNHSTLSIYSTIL